MASEACSESDNADNRASLLVPKTDQNVNPDSKVEADAAVETAHSIPASSNDDDDGRVATADEARDLLHVVDKVPGRVWIACIGGILERFVWYGATAPLRASTLSVN